MERSKNSSAKIIIILAIIAVCVFAAIFGIITLTENWGKTDTQISGEQLNNSLNKMYDRLDVKTESLVKGNVNLDAGEDNDTVLPDIEKYPLSVEGNTNTVVEIFSSTEKSGEGTDGWLIEMAEKFNTSSPTVNGEKVSVSIRSLASGLGMDYISSKKHIPDAFTPSNELWGEMLKEKGIKVNLVEQKLVGNVAGMLFSKSKYKELVSEYGTINLKTVTEAVSENNIAMGYTNPLASSAGLNFLVSTLSTFDSSNPLSDTAVAGFEKFQNNIPFVAYTTLQMRESAKSGALDGFILEAQSYENSSDIKSDYEFIPYGVRHDSPVYEIGNLSDEKKETLKQFIDFCKDEENQKKANSYGFNRYDDYSYELKEMTGENVIQAQKLWREKKSGGKDIAAVFVADVSGSMGGDPILRLQESLLNASKYIGKNNYIGIVTFSDTASIALPLKQFDINQRAYFTGAVESMTDGGGTAMFDGITVAEKMLMDLMETNSNIKPMIFVLTDGETNRGYSLKDTQAIIEGTKIPIYTIGYNANLDVLETLSQINEAATINADTDDVVYQLESFFKAQM